VTNMVTKAHNSLILLRARDQLVTGSIRDRKVTKAEVLRISRPSNP